MHNDDLISYKKTTDGTTSTVGQTDTTSGQTSTTS